MQHATRVARLVVLDGDRGATLRSLRDVGYEVSPATDGRDLLSQIRGALLWDAFDGAVAPARGEGITGLDVLSTVRRAGWPISFLLVAPPGDLRVRSDARRLGAAVIRSSVDLAETCRIVRRVVPVRVPDESFVEAIPTPRLRMLPRP